MQQLLAFLNSEENLLRITHERGHYETHYIKVESEFPNLIYLYYRSFQHSISNPFRDMKFAGIFCRNRNHFACDSYLFDKMKREELVDLTGITLKEVSDVQKQAVDAVKEKVQKLLPFHTENLSERVQLDSYDMGKVKQEAYTHYINNTEVDKDYYTDLYTANMQDEEYPIFVQFLSNNEQAMTEEAERFIQQREEDLGERLKYTKAVIKELKELIRTGQYIERKKMFHAVSKSMKTIQITYEKDGRNLDFKIENSLSTLNDHISTYRMVLAYDKREFESLFGRHADIELDHITEIRYGRKVLYSRETKAA